MGLVGCGFFPLPPEPVGYVIPSYIPSLQREATLPYPACKRISETLLAHLPFVGSSDESEVLGLVVYLLDVENLAYRCSLYPVG